MISADQPHEFVCTECGQHIVSWGAHSEFCLCSLCITLPGWHLDRTLRTMLGPNLPPLPDAEGVHNG